MSAGLDALVEAAVVEVLLDELLTTRPRRQSRASEERSYRDTRPARLADIELVVAAPESASDALLRDYEITAERKVPK